ncbi:MAG: glycosyltransferase family 2 protein [Gammaproteobacteria bacterium]|nr:glycosyltransferase family 2 protein [Gammaproteobacteria bacterium]
MINTSSQKPDRIGAIVVLYFPNQSLLKRLLQSLVHEVDQIFVIDNTPSIAVDRLTHAWFAAENFNVMYQSLGNNLGIAQAQNIGIKQAISNHCDHVVFFDQDSAIPPNMIQELLRYEKLLLDQSIKVGAIGPLFLDEKTGEYSKAIRHGRLLVNKINVDPNDNEPVLADYLISSGSLIRVETLKATGFMREELFIDWVDIEWGLRANKLGYSHFIIPRAIMRHSIGDDFVTLGHKKINLHNDIRNYYIVRNACYLLLDPHVDKRWRVNIAFKIPLYIIFYSLTSKSKVNSFIQLLRACSDAMKGNLGKVL